MTAASILDALLFANIGGGLAVLAVLALRRPLRSLAGARVVHMSWLLVPVVVVATFLPARTIRLVVDAPPSIDAPTFRPAPPATDLSMAPVVMSPPTASPEVAAPMIATTPASTSASIDWPAALVLAWIAGAFAGLGVLIVRQVAAVRSLGKMTRLSATQSRAERSAIGPVVIGILSPRIVLPANFEAVFGEVERKVVVAHEEAHRRGRHTLVRMLAQLGVCLSWFNPLAYLAARAIAEDQELACDEIVALHYPRDRRAYASALLKAQAGPGLPLGCYWPERSVDRLKQRIERLGVPAPERSRRMIGVGVMAMLAACAAVSAWAAKPPLHEVVPAPAQASRIADEPAPAPEEPQQQPQPAAYTKPMWSSRPPSTESLPAEFDRDDPLYVRGKVERIEFGAAKYTVFVRASSIAASGVDPAQTNTSLWGLTPTPYWGDRDAVTRDLANKTVRVIGFNALDKSCAPACSLHVSELIIAGPTALPPISQTPAFGLAEFAIHYDTGKQGAVHGVVTRIEFGERMFDAYVQTRGAGPVPGRVFQVRAEYRFARADIEKQLLGKTVTVAGWAPRGSGAARDRMVRAEVDRQQRGQPSAVGLWAPVTVRFLAPPGEGAEECDTNCAFFGVDFELPGRVKLAPAGAKLIADPKPYDPDPLPAVIPGQAENLELYDYGAPLTLKGVVTRFEAVPVPGQSWLDNRFWVEVRDIVPAGTQGGKGGTLWRIDRPRNLSGPGQYGEWVGREVTVQGYNAKDKTCTPACTMTGEKLVVR